MSLADNKCVPCRGGVPPMEKAKAEEMLSQLGNGWLLNTAGHLERLYTFKDFAQALVFETANPLADPPLTGYTVDLIID